MPTYAIGDIHGHIALLHEAHDLIARDQATAGAGQIIHLGDLVDRGPDSAGVVEYLRAGVARGENWLVIKGNHDRLFGKFLIDPALPDVGLRPVYSWLHPALGGVATLASYGVKSAGDRPVDKVHADSLAAVPQSHRDFIAALPTWQRAEAAIFVHAGIRPNVPMEEQKEDDLVWIRQGFLDYTEPHEALIIHGHTALDAPQHYGNRVNIDSGAAYGGPLTAIAVEGDQVFHLTRAGRVPLIAPQ